MSNEVLPAEALAPDLRMGPNWRARLRIAILMVAIFLPVPLGMAGIRLIAFPENRNLAPFPTPSIKSFDVTGTVKGIDAWIADHFTFRPLLITAWSYFRFLLGDSANPDVLIGSDGWLYSHGGDDMLDDMGVQPAGLASIAAWRQALVERRDWVESQGSRFLFVIAPRKETIYPEHLPPALRKRGTDTQATRLIDALKGTGVDPIYLRDVLLALKAKGVQAYYKLDTHWNEAGGLAAAEALADHIRTILPAVDKRKFTVVGWTEPQIRWPEIERGTATLDYATLLGLPFLKETDAIVAPVDGWKATKQTIYRDGYILYEFTRADAPNLPTLVFYGDSYIFPLMRPLAEYFRRAVFLNPWEEYKGECSLFPPEFVLREHPDIVVNMRLERGFATPVRNVREVSHKPCP